MIHTGFGRRLLSSASIAAGLLFLHAAAQAQTPSDQRWYQIEVTLFAYDNAMQAQEHWPMDVLQQPLPRNTRPLDRITDVLLLPEWQADPTPLSITTSDATTTTVEAVPELPEIAVPLRQSDFRLPDPERDAFLALPRSAHGFTDTNRALTASPRYRVLYHDAWRQPLTGANQAVPVWVSGGQAFGNRHELEGTLTVRFNPGRDRVVLDARLWLTQFSADAPGTGIAGIRLPDISLPGITLPEQALTGTAGPETEPVSQASVMQNNNQQWYATQVIPVINSREMRSNEFHYIDHPAVGIVVHVFPYTVPELPMDPAAMF